MGNSIWVVQTTLPGDWLEPQVGQWAASLVEADLAACIQRDHVTSVYRWEGSVQDSEEWRIQIKTSQSKKKELVKTILANHPYDTPQIAAWKAESTRDYAGWVEG